MHIELHDFPAAAKYFEEALAIQRKVLPKNHPRIINAFYNLGNVQFEMHDYPAARMTFEAALQARRDSQPPIPEAIAEGLNKLGNAQYELRDYQAASASYQEALKIGGSLPTPNQLDIALYLSNLGLAQGRLWNYEHAKKSLEQALVIRRKAVGPESPLVATTLSELGFAQIMLDDYAGAKRSVEEALAIRQKALPKEHIDIAKSHKDLGMLQCELADFTPARKNFEEALLILRKKLPAGHPDIGSCLSFVGWAALGAGDDSRYAGSVLAEATDILLADSLRLGSGQGESAQLETTEGFRLSFTYLMKVALAGGIDPDAVYDRALRVKGSVTARQYAIRIARDSNESKIKDLLEQLKVCNMLLLGQAEVEAASFPRDGSSRLFMLNNRGLGFDDTRSRIEQELLWLSKSQLELIDRRSGGAELVRSMLPEKTTLVDLFEYDFVGRKVPGHKEPIAERRVAAFVIRRDHKPVELVPLGRSDDLARIVSRWRASHGAGKRLPQAEPDPALELRAKVWEPLEKHIGDAKTILLSPDVPLHGVPFCAIPGKNEGTYLLEEYTFAVSPVPQALKDLLIPVDPKFQKPPSLLTMGAIDYNSHPKSPKKDAPKTKVDWAHFPELTNTGPEVRRIGAIFGSQFPNAARLELSNQNATVAAFISQSSKHRYLHLATHGYFAEGGTESSRGPSSPVGERRRAFVFDSRVFDIHPGLASGLFSQGRTRVWSLRALTALDASELDLRGVELITLSACDTARGAIFRGQGVLGLQRSLQVAGAKTVIASLWSVNDESTALLMAEFYRNLWEKKLSKGEALRQRN